MPRYRIELTATADVCTTIEADGDTPEDAADNATEYARCGNAVWKYAGVHDNAEVSSITEIEG